MRRAGAGRAVWVLREGKWDIPAALGDAAGCLGAVAAQNLLGTTLSIGKLRGKVHAYRGTKVVCTYHPAFLLRNQLVSEKRKVWEDLLQVMEKLRLSISEKQRGYFLKG